MINKFDDAVKLKRGLDYLNYYLGIDEEKIKKYYRRGKANNLRRIAIKLYRRHHRKRAKSAMLDT